MTIKLSKDSIEQAMIRIADYKKTTPLLTSTVLDQHTSCQIFLKAEHLQDIAAFKIRGAANAILSLPAEQLKNGVVTHSAGNHAQAIAAMAAKLNIPAYIVMPENTPRIKVEGVKSHATSQITFCKPTQQSREQTAQKIQKLTSAKFIHPYNDYAVMAGQGTIAIELLEQIKGLDTVIVPIGGCGLISGIATYLKETNPQIRIIGVEPLGANDTLLSLQSGKVQSIDQPKSIADGLLGTVGSLTFPVIQKHVDEVLCVSEEEISQTLLYLHQRTGITVEPSGAVALTPLHSHKIDLKGEKVAVILSGGNYDQNLGII